MFYHTGEDINKILRIAFRNIFLHVLKFITFLRIVIHCKYAIRIGIGLISNIFYDFYYVNL